MKTTLVLHAGLSSSGVPVHEELRVEQRGPDTYVVLASPGLVLGVAAGDLIRASTPRDFEVLARGGNVCVQLFCGAGVGRIEPFATGMLARVDARLDGQSARQLVYTVPVASGFTAIEQALDEVIERFPDAEWYFGNVFDPADGVTPLNWWT